MCFECWKQHGSPVVVDEDTRVAKRVIGSVFEMSRRGGSLQPVILDWELTDDALHSARQELDYLRNHWKDGGGDCIAKRLLAAETECLSVLERLPFQKRVAALAMHEEFY